jgi:hypothetical protein
MTTCETCRFWWIDNEGDPVCRRYPPHATFKGDWDSSVGSTHYYASFEFPVANADNWCGEHEPKKEKEKDNGTEV